MFRMTGLSGSDELPVLLDERRVLLQGSQVLTRFLIVLPYATGSDLPRLQARALVASSDRGLTSSSLKGVG